MSLSRSNTLGSSLVLLAVEVSALHRGKAYTLPYCVAATSMISTLLHNPFSQLILLQRTLASSAQPKHSLCPCSCQHSCSWQAVWPQTLTRPSHAAPSCSGSHRGAEELLLPNGGWVPPFLHPRLSHLVREEHIFNNEASTTVNVNFLSYYQNSARMDTSPCRQSQTSVGLKKLENDWTMKRIRK